MNVQGRLDLVFAPEGVRIGAKLDEQRRFEKAAGALIGNAIWALSETETYLDVD